MISTENKPPLYGLILCGGMSWRMHADKSQLHYRGIPHWQYIYRLLENRVGKILLSCRKEQAGSFEKLKDALVFDDEKAGFEGPAAGILAAHSLAPKAAFLVLACDLPLITHASIDELLVKRNVKNQATAFINPEKQWFEPLVAIWEPEGLEVLKDNMSNGLNCPRKTLKSLNPTVAGLPILPEIFNANTPEERTMAEKELKAIKNGG